MDIYAKSALKVADIEAKLDIGCDGIEIQLLSELVKNKLGTYYTAKEVFDLESLSIYPIKAVHVPILSFYGVNDITLEDFVDEDIVLLEEVFKIANYFGRKQNCSILIIIHSETTLQLMKRIGNLWTSILHSIDTLLEKYPYTELCIENVTPLRNIRDNHIVLCNNFRYDNVDIATELKKELQTNRIGTVLDTCHAKISKKYIEGIYKIAGDRICGDYSLDSYFRENKEVIKLIHLADMSGSGFGSKSHGVPITEANEEFAKQVIDLYNAYNYVCPITLEVYESDYLKNDNYRITKEIINKYI